MGGEEGATLDVIQLFSASKMQEHVIPYELVSRKRRNSRLTKDVSLGWQRDAALKLLCRHLCVRARINF